jgi:hypothetical protein
MKIESITAWFALIILLPMALSMLDTGSEKLKTGAAFASTSVWLHVRKIGTTAKFKRVQTAITREMALDLLEGSFTWVVYRRV